jgi:hypothetical protein
LLLPCASESLRLTDLIEWHDDDLPLLFSPANPRVARGIHRHVHGLAHVQWASILSAVEMSDNFAIESGASPETHPDAAHFVEAHLDVRSRRGRSLIEWMRIRERVKSPLILKVQLLRKLLVEFAHHFFNPSRSP